MIAIKCKVCEHPFSSLLVPKEAAVQDVLLQLGNHAAVKHPAQVKDAIDHLHVLMNLIGTYIGPNELGSFDAGLSLDGPNAAEQYMKELHRLITEAITPPTVDIKPIVQVN